MACGRFLRLLSSLPPCAVMRRRLQLQSSSHFVCSYQTQHLCLGAVPFPFSFPPFLIQFLPSLYPSFPQQLPPSISNYEGAANTFPPPLSLSFSPSSNNNTKATNAKSVPRLCQLLLVGLVHSFFFSRPYREGRGQGSPPPLFRFFFFLKRKNAMVKRRFVEKKKN